MPTAFPAAIDNFTDPTAVNNLSDAPVLHHSQHADVNAAVRAIEQELGTNTKGTATSVRERIVAIENSLANKVNTVAMGQPGGVASLDGGSQLAQNIDAAKITSGTVPVARIPNLSGAKILGTVGGGAAIPVDAVPALDTGKINTGIFPVARIPDFDAAKIASGTIAAARLPSSVTANANATVVNDQSGRDAIPLIDRANGKLVVQLDKMILWTWRSDNSTWVEMPNVQNTILSIAATTTINGGWTNIPNLSFDALAGETYRIELTAFCICTGSSGVDIRFGWTWTGTGTMHCGVQGPGPAVVSPNTTGEGQWGATLADASSPLQPTSVSGAVGLPSGLNVTARVYGVYICTVSGTVNLQIAQDIANGSFLPTLQVGTNLRAERLV